MDDFDWKNPDYPAIFQRRLDALGRVRANPSCLPALQTYYRDNPARFICDWGITLNAKNVERGLPSFVPFILYPRQIEWVNWVVSQWRDHKPGITEKTRQMGFSWLSMALACTLCLFHPGMVIGVGSRKQEYIDVLGDPKSLIQKCREFMSALPVEFRGGWNVKEHAPHMRMMFPESGSILTGEAGENIGRGNTTSLYFVDEAAFLERPLLVDAALSQTTNCRIDISTPNGMANPFAQKRHSGKIDVFSFHWRDDPTKDDKWYQDQVEFLAPVVVAQEIDINYSASVEGILIPAIWVQAAIDAHVKLQFKPSGARSAALDVADQGIDTNAFCGAQGVVITDVVEWSGAESDIYRTTLKAFELCDLKDYPTLRYDADGLGAGVRGDARIINQARQASRNREVNVEAFRGSAGVFEPEREDVKGRKNEDFFANCKAQSWWALRSRFQRTYRAIQEGVVAAHDDLISLPSGLPSLSKLMVELSQPTYSVNNAGKIVIDKQPDGAKSPNLADAVMIRFAVVRRPAMRITAEDVARMRSRVAA